METAYDVSKSVVPDKAPLLRFLPPHHGSENYSKLRNKKYLRNLDFGLERCCAGVSADYLNIWLCQWL